MPIILDIQKRAVEEGNSVQMIKSLKAEFGILRTTKDDNKNDENSLFFKKILQTEKYLKGNDLWLLKALEGDFILDYYGRNRWKINQRTNIANADLQTIETWSKLDFKNYLTQLYSELEANRSTLKNIQLSDYKEIFSQSNDLDYYPTLFDWNAAQQVEFLVNKNIFTPNEIKENRKKSDQIFNELIESNSGNAKLYFQVMNIDGNCQYFGCKNKAQQLINLYNSSTIGDYKVEIADQIMDELVGEQKYEEALLWAKKAKEDYPKSKFVVNVQDTENRIKNPSINISYEDFTLPNQPIHIVADYKNVSEFTLNIYKVKDVSSALPFIREYYNSPALFSNVSKQLVRTETYTLPKNYKNHQTSLEIKPLEKGLYVAELKIDDNNVNPFWFAVSDARLVYDNLNTKSGDIFKMVTRETGQELNRENISVYQALSSNFKQSKTSIKTDDNGNFRLPKTKEYQIFVVETPDGSIDLMRVYGDKGFFDGKDNYDEDEGHVQIFLDRGIYRPGQIVYFKAIATVYDEETKRQKVAENILLNISLKDTNGDEISKTELKTNEFGSVNGSFTLPQGKLNGHFMITINDDSVYNSFSGAKFFQVEEYKRPKFEVEFEPLKEEYKYGQTIELKGKATTFSGIPLNNTAVNYEIKKQNIRWRYFSWYPRVYDNENSILGEVQTNEKGEFTIKLDLKKDENLEGLQVDNYQVNASVTDINGETQSAETNVKVASVSHYIQAETLGSQFSDKDIQLKVETKNYDGQNLNKSYHVKLSKLKEPQRIFRDNFKDRIQDMSVMSETEFVKKFPHDYFDKNDEVKYWKVEKVIYDKIVQYDNGKLLEVFPSLGEKGIGTYRLELYNIEGKDTIKTEQIFEVWDKKSLSKNQNPFLKAIAEKTELNRNEKAKVYLYSAIPDAMVYAYIQNGKGDTKTEKLKIKKGFLKYEIPMPADEDINQINVQFVLPSYNDVQTEAINFSIIKDEKPIRIETITFRDKLQLGSKETWSIKVIGDTSGKAISGAEVLANMYDKSLDQFTVNTYIWQDFVRYYFYQNSYDVHTNLSNESYNGVIPYLEKISVFPPSFSWFDNEIYGDKMLSPTSSASNVRIRGVSSISDENEVEEVVMVAYGMKRKSATTDSAVDKMEAPKEAVISEDLSKIAVRQNLNETAFFYPNLLTDKDGNVSFEFTSPEALTQWKLMFLAHTKDARAAVLEKEVVTQKEFSVTPNYPRFLREGDELNLQSKLSNLTSLPLNGTAQLQILDAFTNEDISFQFNLNDTQKSFTLDAQGNSVVNWNLKVPNNVESIILKVVAKAGNFSDGEQKAIAILPNRMLVTDAVPIFVKEGQTKTFTLENLKNSNSQTISNVSNTLELTTNPIWEILFALPSLKDDQNLSAEVHFNKWFADVLASEIFKANPKMKTVFEEYQAKGLLNSNLEKNQELKQLLLEETPWVLDSKSETEQMQKLARLFDANTMRNSINQDWSDVVKLQNSDGGFSWYQGYPSSYYTSLYILKNLGRINEWLKGNLGEYQSSEQKEMVAKLVNYLDNEVQKYWDTSTSLSVTNKSVWNNYVLDYLDTRHYWEKDYPLKGKGAQLKMLVIEKAPKAEIKDFTFFGLHRAALLFNDYKLTNLSKKLMTYLKETSTETETLGVYWKQNLNDWGWYSSKTVNHAGALEAFNKLTPTDTNFIEEMKIWLITQKEVSNWDTSRSTAEVIFTILNSGKSWTSNESDEAKITWGDASSQPSPKEKELNSAKNEVQRIEKNKTKNENAIVPLSFGEGLGERLATGYYKKSIQSDKIDKNLATVTIKKDSPGIVQGGLYWQYYEDLDKIKSTETYISITKELYKKVKTENGEELQKITENSPLKVGDKVTVRMILNTDRNMEFIHLKDMRAAGFEPLNVISKYQWNNGLGYYESTKDASTNFYIQYMPKGKYVFEYDLVCNASGTFSNGISTLQNYYAPQMNAHTNGTKVKISE